MIQRDRSPLGPRSIDSATAAVIETLEERLQLSAVLSPRGTLLVQGTNNADQIVVRRDPARPSKILVSMNGSGAKFASSSVKRIEMNGLGGNDRLTLDDTLAVISARGATLWGGEGNDTLVGGLAPTTLDGGNGNDSITGSTADDFITGGAGDDWIHGSKGNDLILAGDGKDIVYGWRGDDMIYGDAGDDTLFGQDGNDTVAGDGEDRLGFTGTGVLANYDGHDRLDGGVGDDWLVGGPQSLTIMDKNGLDTLVGGAGNDILDSRGWWGVGNDVDVITDRASGDIVPMEWHTRQLTPAEVEMGDDAYGVLERAKIVIRINDGGTVRDVVVPAGIGVFADPNLADTRPQCHTHNADGIIYMADTAERDFTLGEFFRNWGVSISATHIGRYVAGNGRTLTWTVRHANGQTESIANPYTYVIQGNFDPAQGDLITVTYA